MSTKAHELDPELEDAMRRVLHLRLKRNRLTPEIRRAYRAILREGER